MKSSTATIPSEPLVMRSADQNAAVRPSTEIPRGSSLRRTRVLQQGLASADLLSSLIAGLGVAWIAGLQPSQMLGFSAAVALCWVGVAFGCGMYATNDLRSWAGTSIDEIRRLLFAAVALSWLLFGLATAIDAPHPFAGALAGSALVGIAAVAGRGLARGAVHRVGGLEQRVMIVGSGFVAGELAASISRRDDLGLVLVGLIDDEIYEAGGPGIPQLGRLDDLGAALSEFHIDRAMFAFSRASHEELLECIRTCRDHNVVIDVVPRLFEFLDGARSLNNVGGLPLLSLGAPQLSWMSRAAKRTMDILVSGVALLMLAPLLLAVAIAIKVDSRGPVFFSQIRAGRLGRRFRLLKFRSMEAGADESKDEVLPLNEADDGVMFKIRADPRITRVGKLIRRLSIDELPQLVNVLKGDMSLVGPRPLILPETDALDDWQVRRLDLRPGITGPWQVYGRSDIPFQDMVRFDYQYVAGWSLARDVEILLATIPAVLSGRGAY